MSQTRVRTLPLQSSVRERVVRASIRALHAHVHVHGIKGQGRQVHLWSKTPKNIGGFKMNAAIQYTAVLEVEGLCITCGVPIAMPREIIQRRRQDAKLFYCFNGHAQCFTESEADKLRKQLEAERKQLEQERQRHMWTKQDLEKQKNANAGLRGEITRVKNRVGNGVCPCCNRSFTNLRRHMDTKHPEFKNE